MKINKPSHGLEDPTPSGGCLVHLSHLLREMGNHEGLKAEEDIPKDQSRKLRKVTTAVGFQGASCCGERFQVNRACRNLTRF